LYRIFDLLENVVAQSPIILWSIDREGDLRLSRRGGLTALGVPTDDRAGIHVFESMPEDHPLAKYIRQALEGASVYVDYKVGGTNL
jgi:hypothetical protein